MQNGWIKLHRKFKKWEWYKKSEMVHLFLHFLLLANCEDNKWQGKLIKRGQIITGLDILSKDTNISRQTLRTCINRLISTSEITSKSTNKYRLITILNYDKYQELKKILTSKLTSKLTNNQQSTNNQLTANKNNKNNKNTKNTKAEASAGDSLFNFNSVIRSLLENQKDRRMPIIANYWKYKKICFKNKEQYQAGLRRELRPAKNLIGYDIDRIKEVMFWLNGTNIDWTIETVGKYVERDLTNLKSKLYGNEY